MATSKVVEEVVVVDERPTIDDVFESITGFEEIAVEKAFGGDPTEIANAGKHMRFLRVMVFIMKRREGLNDVQAKQEAMAMRVKDLDAFFADEPEEDSNESEESGEAEALSED